MQWSDHGRLLDTRKASFADFMKSLKDTTNVTMPQEVYAMITEMIHIDNRFDDLPTFDQLKQRQLILTEKMTLISHG